MNSPARFMVFNRKQKIAACTVQQGRPKEDSHAPGFRFPKLTLTRTESPSLRSARGPLGNELRSTGFGCYSDSSTALPLEVAAQNSGCKRNR